MSVIDKFLKYVSFDTQSDENSDCVPSTSKQLILGKELKEDINFLNKKFVITGTISVMPRDTLKEEIALRGGDVSLSVSKKSDVVIVGDSPGSKYEMAVKLGRSTRSDLHVGVCGETGGDPKSIEFYHKVGLDYVSCSPFRVPVARLAAAQANIRNPRKN